MISLTTSLFALRPGNDVGGDVVCGFCVFVLTAGWFPLKLLCILLLTYLTYFSAAAACFIVCVVNFLPWEHFTPYLFTINIPTVGT